MGSDAETEARPMARDCPANVLMHFMAWLTSRSEPSGPFSEVHSTCGDAASLVKEYCEVQGLTFDDAAGYDGLRPMGNA